MNTKLSQSNPGFGGSVAGARYGSRLSIFPTGAGTAPTNGEGCNGPTNARSFARIHWDGVLGAVLRDEQLQSGTARLRRGLMGDAALRFCCFRASRISLAKW